MDSFNLFFFNLIFFFLVGKIKVFFGNFIDIESVFSLKNFFQRFGIEINLVDINFIVNDFRYNFIFIDLDFDTFNYVLVNLNLRVEIPLLNSKLKKKMMKNNFNIYNFSGKDVLGKFLNNDFLNYSNIFSFRQKLCYFLLFFTFLYICFNFLKNLVSVKFFFGWNFFQRNYFFFNNLFLKLTNKYNIITYNIILSTISLINYFEFFYVKISNINLNLYNSFVFLAQVDDELFLNKLYLLKDKDINSFFVYSGSFFDNGAKISNLIFPLNMFFEYNGLFLNLSGKFRKNRKVVSSLSFLYNISSLFESFNNFFVLKIVGLNFFYFSIFSFFKKFKFYLCFYVIYFFDLKKIYIEEDKFLKFGLYSNILFKSLI